MLSCLLSCVYQTHDMISIYPLYIISCLYSVSYHILTIKRTFIAQKKTNLNCIENCARERLEY